ncbi:MAG: type IV secretion system DNA-binding domain-containing protein [Spirosomataceae bacterium]
MQVPTYNVLFIDDHHHRYLPGFQPVAATMGIELYATHSASDGLDFLADYAPIINAVILDLRFPEGEMQGIKALQEIKRKYEYLPVVILTESDSAEAISLVVTCMKEGAYNYVGKGKGAVYLFQVVETAIQQQQVQLRLRSKSTPPETEPQFTTLTQRCLYGTFTERTMFGFELVSINKPSSHSEAAQLHKAALRWHENLLKSISYIYRDEIQLNLKYQTEGNKVRCRLIFTVYAEDEASTIRRVNNLQHDITTFFATATIDTIQPYFFEPIQDKAFLSRVHELPSQYQYTVFYRKPIKVKTTQSIGFNSYSKTTKNDDYQPDEVFPPADKSTFDPELFRALLNQKEDTEIDVQLIPKRLLKQEIDLIRQVVTNPSSIRASNLTQDEHLQLVTHLQKLIAANDHTFMVSVVLKSAEAYGGQHLKTGIFNYFFSQPDVVYSARKPEALWRYSTVEGIQNQLSFFYDIQEAIQAFHLPFPETSDLHGIKMQSYAFQLLPDNLSQSGIELGRKNKIGSQHTIRLSEDSLARHLYITGQTGTGKSTLLKTMIADCLTKNKGFTVIDPHGDLFDDVMKMIPKNKQQKVFILNTTDASNSVALNPLHYDEKMPQAKSLVINEMLRAFASLYNMKEAGGPMFETYFKNSLLLLMDEAVQARFGKGTLSEASKIFNNDDYRRQLLNTCENQSVIDFFRTAEAQTGEQVFANFALYITSKLTRFVEDYYLAPFLSSKKANIDFRKLIDEGNILLVKMDKGLIGADNTRLLGQIVLSKLFIAGMSRTNTSIEKRKPHSIFVDEFQNFVNGDVGDALSEVRKYGLSLILANQTLGQLNDYLLQSLLGNVGSLVFFRPGINDYEKIRHYLEPDFNREDVLKLPNFNCIARLMIDHVPSDPFVFQTKLDKI